jgi:uncharacterized membrane protein
MYLFGGFWIRFGYTFAQALYDPELVVVHAAQTLENKLIKILAFMRNKRNKFANGVGMSWLQSVVYIVS